jgi:hypothetical protein
MVEPSKLEGRSIMSFSPAVFDPVQRASDKERARSEDMAQYSLSSEKESLKRRAGMFSSLRIQRVQILSHRISVAA